MPLPQGLPPAPKGEFPLFSEFLLSIFATMLTVSLHGIKIIAPHGLYPEEHILGNTFEIDVDIFLPDALPWPFADYTIIRKTVTDTFQQPGKLLETFALHIHAALKENFPVADKIKVAVRKLHPPMPGHVAYAQVCYEA
jgi:dihydroneopterin aldolase